MKYWKEKKTDKFQGAGVELGSTCKDGPYLKISDVQRQTEEVAVTNNS
jgi:hypothetical protein